MRAIEETGEGYIARQTKDVPALVTLKTDKG